MDSIKVPLVINKLQNKDIYDYLASQGMIGANEIYLIENDDDEYVVDVSYDSENKKLTYTDTANNTNDIVSVSVLRTAMQLSGVATSGSYNDLGNQPAINGITLTSSTMSRNLNISYNDLSNQPTIPTVTSSYSSSDTTYALNGVAVSSALQNYVPTSLTVTGFGALGGGGTLTQNRRITHNQAPTGLTPQAVKVASDAYGHVQIGAEISAADIGATPTTYSILGSCEGIDASQDGTLLILGTTNESVSFSQVPPFGRRIILYYANITNNDIVITIDPSNFSTSTYFFFNGRVLTNSTTYTVGANTNLCMMITLIQRINGNTTEVFTFADVLHHT